MEKDRETKKDVRQRGWLSDIGDSFGAGLDSFKIDFSSSTLLPFLDRHDQGLGWRSREFAYTHTRADTVESESCARHEHQLGGIQIRTTSSSFTR